MTDFDFEQRLRGWYRDEVGEDLAPESLHMSLPAVTAEIRPGTVFSRRTLLLVAALLLLTIALAAGFGSGLIKLPTFDNSSLVSIGGECDRPLPDRVVLAVEGTWWEPSANQRLVLFDDGLMTYGPHVPSEGELAVFRQRRLTDEGVGALLDSLRGSGLGDCENVHVARLDANQVAFDVAVQSAGQVVRFRVGPGNMDVGEASAESVSAASLVASRFAGLDLGLPASAWADATWIDVAPERFAVWATYFPFDYGEGIVEPSPAWDVPLADGSTLRTLGEPFAETSSSPIGGISRCGLVTADTTQSLIASLAPFSDISQDGDTRQLVLGPSVGGGDVLVVAAFPTATNCQDALASRYLIPRQPPESTSAPRLADVDECGFVPNGLLPGDLVSEAWDEQWSRCTTTEVNEQTSGITLYARRFETSSAESEQLAALDFGIEGFSIEEIGGQTVYINECLTVPAVCQPAVAIAAEPYYLVIAAFPQFAGDTPTPEDYRRLESWLRQVVGRIIEGLDERRSGST